MASTSCHHDRAKNPLGDRRLVRRAWLCSVAGILGRGRPDSGWFPHTGGVRPLIESTDTFLLPEVSFPGITATEKENKKIVFLKKLCLRFKPLAVSHLSVWYTVARFLFSPFTL